MINSYSYRGGNRADYVTEIPINNTKVFLENNVKQVVYAALTDLNWLKKRIDGSNDQEVLQQIQNTEKTLAQCLHDIDQFILQR